MLKFTKNTAEYNSTVSITPYHRALAEAVSTVQWGLVPSIEKLRAGDVILMDEKIQGLTKDGEFAVLSGGVKVSLGGRKVWAFLVDHMDYSDELADGKGGNPVALTYNLDMKSYWNENPKGVWLQFNNYTESINGYSDGFSGVFLGGLRFRDDYTRGVSWVLTRGQNMMYLYHKKNGYWRVYAKLDRGEPLAGSRIDLAYTSVFPGESGFSLKRGLTFGDILVRCLYDERGRLIDPTPLKGIEGVQGLIERHNTVDQDKLRLEFQHRLMQAVQKDYEERYGIKNL